MRAHCSANIFINGRIKSQKRGEPNEKIIIKNNNDRREGNPGLGWEAEILAYRFNNIMMIKS